MIEKILNQNQLVVFAKDINLKYTFVNEAGAELAGLDSPSQIIGKTDYDFVWKPQADLYRHDDANVLKGAVFVNIQQPRNQRNGLVQVLHTKTILQDKKGYPIGVSGTALELNGYTLTKNNGYFDPIKNVFYLGTEFSNEYFTRCELAVFRYLLSGDTIEKIALCMFRSVKTIQSHVKNIANKLQCSHKSEIVPTAIKHGLTYILDEMAIVKDNI